LKEFAEFMRVNMRLAQRTVRETVENTARYLESSNCTVSYESVADYLKAYLTKAPETYNGQITTLRRFVRDFLGFPELIMSFKMAPVDAAMLNCNHVQLPSKLQLRNGFEALHDTEGKAIYLFTATTGLRKSEIYDLTKAKVDFKLRAVVPQHYTRVKRSGITFYNVEAETWLNQYLTERHDSDLKMFVVSDRKWRMIWKTASEAAGIKISPKILRVWFATELGELNVPDRFVDIFQGRAPRTVLAKHYTAKNIERLKRIYDSAGLKVCS
jgi:site-specific recombinase XerD